MNRNCPEIGAPICLELIAEVEQERAVTMMRAVKPVAEVVRDRGWHQLSDSEFLTAVQEWVDRKLACDKLLLLGSAANDMANLPRQTELEQACKKAVRPNHDYVDAVESNLQRHSKVTPCPSGVHSAAARVRASARGRSGSHCTPAEPHAISIGAESAYSSKIGTRFGLYPSLLRGSEMGSSR